MPEITDAEYRQFMRYQTLGTVEELERLPKKVSELEADNKGQRDEIRDLKEKVPGDGALVLTGEDAKRYPTLAELGDPKEVAEKLQAGEAARAALADVQWRENARAAATAAGLNPDAFLALPGVKGLDFEIRTEKDGDEEVRRAYATPKEGDDRKPVALSTDYIEARDDWKPLRPALVAKPDAGSTETREKAAAPWPRQKEADRGTGGYDPAAAGKAMAEKQKEQAGDDSLAFR